MKFGIMSVMEKRRKNLYVYLKKRDKIKITKNFVGIVIFSKMASLFATKGIFLEPIFQRKYVFRKREASTIEAAKKD